MRAWWARALLLLPACAAWSVRERPNPLRPGATPPLARTSLPRTLLRLNGGAGADVHEHSVSAAVSEVPSEPFAGQKPGTSGLRKRVDVVMQPRYLENFVQAIFDVLGAETLSGKTLVVSGDGRYHNAAAIQTICALAAANGVARVWVGVGGLLSTPAASAVVREREGGAAVGALILTASHNPGGPDGDFGIKYNVENGGPALEAFTNAVHARTESIRAYRKCEGLPEVDLSAPGRHVYIDAQAGRPFFEVEVIDRTEDYATLIRSLFDLDAIRSLLARPDMSFAYDAMHGVAGPYAHAIFEEELGVPASSLHNCEPKEDFGGGHPDPNLIYAGEMVEAMGLDSNGRPLPNAESAPVLGAAADGDADRNMILGRGFFVTPSDSVAIIAAHAADVLPYVARAGGLKAVARSMPTSGALDDVAKALGLPLFETPTGWKFFGNLMDASALGYHADLAPLICGEESFGTGSSHVREKDGIWAVLCWLSILAKANANTPVGELIGVGDVVRSHWRKYGRHFYSRYDYEGVDAGAAAKLVARLEGMGAMFSAAGYGPTADGAPRTLSLGGFELASIDQFRYVDPVDGAVSANQGLRLLFADGSRIVVRLSGTGSVGATVRIYIERYQPAGDDEKLFAEMADALEPLVSLAMELTQVRELTGRETPTVIT